MAFGNINIPPLLLPWQHQGLRHVLMHEDLPPERSLCHRMQSAYGYDMSGQNVSKKGAFGQAQQVSQASQSCAQSQGSVPREMARGQTHIQQNTVYAPASHTSPAGHVQKPSAPSNMSGANISSSPYRLQGPAFLPPEHWPNPWQERLRATKNGNILWTYATLAEDLCIQAHAERRIFLHKLLTDLQYPTGTHTFWPPTMPAHMPVNGETVQKTFVANAQIFWSGVHMLQAKALVIMGQAATKAIGLPDTIRPFMQLRYNGRFVVVLRDVDLLITEPARYGAVLEFLRQALAPYRQNDGK